MVNFTLVKIIAFMFLHTHGDSARQTQGSSCQICLSGALWPPSAVDGWHIWYAHFPQQEEVEIAGGITVMKHMNTHMLEKKLILE